MDHERFEEIRKRRRKITREVIVLRFEVWTLNARLQSLADEDERLWKESLAASKGEKTNG